MKKFFFVLIVSTVCVFGMAQQTSHMIQRGDTFELIARRYNISLDQLLAANPGVDQCYSGMTLNLPEDARLNDRMVVITPQDIIQIEEASGYLKNGKYKKAVSTYSKAIENNPSATLYFGRALSYFNREKYKSAIKDFEMAMTQSDCTDDMKTKCRQLVTKAKELRADQHQRRNEIWGGVAAAVVGAAAIATTAAMANNNYNSISYMPPSSANGFQRDTSLDYLLDPRLAMIQVQQQELEEYETYKRMFGTDITLDQYRILKYSSPNPKINDDGSNDNNYDKKENDNRYKTDYSDKFNTRYSSGRQCVRCFGTGKCQTCNGKGWYYGSNSLTDPLTCPNCDRDHNGVCSHCHGTKVNP